MQCVRVLPSSGITVEMQDQAWSVMASSRLADVVPLEKGEASQVHTLLAVLRAADDMAKLVAIKAQPTNGRITFTFCLYAISSEPGSNSLMGFMKAVTPVAISSAAPGIAGNTARKSNDALVCSVQPLFFLLIIKAPYVFR